MPDTRKHILVEPKTHDLFMKWADKRNKTQNTGIEYLVRFNKMVEKVDKELYDSINFIM